MKKILIPLAIVAFLPLLAAPPAEAGIFSVGVAFNVGGFFFDLGFGGPRYSTHASHHVYRVGAPLHYAGHQCHSGCYRDAGYYYHHADCPVVAYHFRSYGFSPYVAYPSFFAPPAYGYYGYRSYHRYDRRYRYDRHPRHYRQYRPYTYRDHHYRGWNDRRDRDRRRYERDRGDRYRDRGVRDRRNDHRRRDLTDRRSHGERQHRQRMDRSERRRHETRGSDRGARKREAGASRSRGSGGRRP